MPTATDLLSEKVNRILKKGSDISDMSKEDFRNYIGITHSELKAFIEGFSELKPEENKALGMAMMDEYKNRSAMNIQIYQLYTSRLNGQAQRY